MKSLIKLIRPKQWLKNVFVFIPMFFGGSLLDGADIIACLVVFMAYCFVASAVYCFNDIHDVDADRRHPVKCKRPLAAGEVSIAQAYILMGVLTALAFATLALLKVNRGEVMAVVLTYFLLNIAYCTKLKHYAILDVCIVAFGFVLRILVGGIATEIVLSKWLVMMTFLLTLFLSFAKRRDDVVRMELTGEAPRNNTTRYNLTFINQAITITASVTLVCYIMYTISPEVTQRVHTDYLYLTTIYVLLGLLRYIQITVVDKRSGDPTKVMLHDVFTQLIVVLWAATFLFIIYIL